MALDGHEVTVLEKTDKIGGLALTFKDGDYLFDLGPHILHTFHEDTGIEGAGVLGTAGVEHDGGCRP